MHPALTRTVAAFVAAGALLGMAACADPDDSTDSGTTVAPLTSAEVKTVPPTAPPTTLGPGMVSGTDTVYEIKGGDVLSSIAAHFKVPLDELVAYNEWADGSNHTIHPGQEIKIPPGYTVPEVTPSTTTAPAGDDATTSTDGDGTSSTDADASSTAPPTTTDTAAGGTYVVEENDYLSGIAQKVGTTVDKIVEANGWSDGAGHNIYPGDEIKIP